MQILPDGFVLPPLPYVIGLAGVALIVVALLVALKPAVTQRTVVGFAPWMAVGGALHAFYQLDAFSDLWAPFFGAPAVYVTTFVMAGVAWLAVALLGMGSNSRFVARYLGLSGLGVLTVLFVLAIWQGLGLGSVDPIWPSIGLLAALVLTALLALAISLWRTPVYLRMRLVGPLVIFAHALDGVSTAIGADVYGVTERTPLPRAIMDLAADLPTAEAMGVGWLFVLVKLAVAAGIVVAFNRFVDEEPFYGNVTMAFIAAVGLGPATNNLFLFFVGA